jgi:hypothetical protein
VGQERMTSFWLLEVTKLERAKYARRHVTSIQLSSSDLRVGRFHWYHKSHENLSPRLCLNTNTEKMDGWMHGCMDAWIDGQTDRQLRGIERRPCPSSLPTSPHLSCSQPNNSFRHDPTPVPSSSRHENAPVHFPTRKNVSRCYKYSAEKIRL